MPRSEPGGPSALTDGWREVLCQWAEPGKDRAGTATILSKARNAFQEQMHTPSWELHRSWRAEPQRPHQEYPEISIKSKQKLEIEQVLKEKFTGRVE